VPLYIRKDVFDSAMSSLGNGGIFSVREFRKISAGIIITGTEIASGRVKDGFEPVISGILKNYGCEIIETIICRDNRKEISEAAERLLELKAGMIVAAGGLSVDPDDLTVPGLEDAGLTDTVYGAPILPGAMTLIGKIGTTDVIGVPAGALYSKPAAFDILLPIILSGIRITRLDLAEMAAGGLLETSLRS
jgi:formylmethanofuran dehydrogenase subunit E